LSNKASPVVISLRQPYVDALARRAEQLRMGEAEAAAALLSHALEPYLDAANADQAKAERELLEVAEKLAREEARGGDWNEHLTLAVFRRIEAEHPALYEQAAGSQQSQLNRRIGRRIKEGVGATVKLDHGKPAVVHAPRSSQGLIRRYTLLTKP
jgi:hypothetical protein